MSEEGGLNIFRKTASGANAVTSKSGKAAASRVQNASRRKSTPSITLREVVRKFAMCHSSSTHLDRLGLYRLAVAVWYSPPLILA